MLKITKDSHLDHGLTQDQVNHLLETFKDEEGFTIKTITLPEELGKVPCGLYGPAMGDLPLISGRTIRFNVHKGKRGGREYESRLVDLPHRLTREVTVIMGPHEGEPCVLYTAFGGPLTPKEPKDPTLTPEEKPESVAFWVEHALSSGNPNVTEIHGGLTQCEKETHVEAPKN